MIQLWQIYAGLAAATLSIIATLWKFHSDNKKKIQEETVKQTEMRSKLDHVFEWIENNGEDFLRMKITVDRWDKWFEGVWKDRRQGGRDD